MAAAGPVSNLIMAGLVAIALRVIIAFSLIDPYAGTVQLLVLRILLYLVLINVFLFVFNLLPIPPLDGYRVMLGAGEPADGMADPPVRAVRVPADRRGVPPGGAGHRTDRHRDRELPCRSDDLLTAPAGGRPRSASSPRTCTPGSGPRSAASWPPGCLRRSRDSSRRCIRPTAGTGSTWSGGSAPRAGRTTTCCWPGSSTTPGRGAPGSGRAWRGRSAERYGALPRRTAALLPGFRPALERLDRHPEASAELALRGGLPGPHRGPDPPPVGAGGRGRRGAASRGRGELRWSVPQTGARRPPSRSP